MLAHKPYFFLTECGPNFTSKLEGMFKDMELSKELMATWIQVMLVLRGVALFRGVVLCRDVALCRGVWQRILLPSTDGLTEGAQQY